MTIHPKRQRDLMLAPVAAEIDLNLQRLRDRTPYEIAAALEHELDSPAMDADRHQRVELVLRQAMRAVEMHGWTAWITDDYTCVHLDGGSVSLDVGLSATLQEYLRSGVPFVQEAG